MNTPAYRVEFGPAANRVLEAIFHQERTATGWPSIADVQNLWLPEATAVVAQGWDSSAPISEGRTEDVRGVAMKAYLSIFPPSSMAVYRVPGVDEANAIRLIVIGVSFDRKQWEAARIEGLND